MTGILIYFMLVADMLGVKCLATRNLNIDPAAWWDQTVGDN